MFQPQLLAICKELAIFFMCAAHASTWHIPWRISCTHQKTCTFLADGQQLRPEPVRAVINK